MLDQFNVLSVAEFEKLKDAIPLITIMIAGADGTMDQSELEWAEKVTHIRGYKMKKEMKEFYLSVGETISERLQYFINSYPKDPTERNNKVTDALAELNPILAKLNNNLGANLYKSFLSFAEHVAKASGGVMGFFTIGSDEAKLIGLSMIDPILIDQEEEE